MLNRRSVDAVAAAAVSARETRPLYGSYCFSRIPWTLESALTGEPNPRSLPPDTLGALAGRPRTVVLLFVDAFGWRFFEEHAERTPALARFLRDGTVSKLTSLFPSTTSAHVACLHSGLTPAESGIYEWYQYEPAVGEMIAPLLSSRAGEKGRDGLDLPPGVLFEGETLHERLAARGVRSTSVTPAEFTPSPFNDEFTRGTTEVPYKGLARGLNALVREVRAPGGPEPRLIHYYYGGIDRNAHRFGPGSTELRATVRRFFDELERRFFAVLERDRDGGATGGRRTEANEAVTGAGTGASGETCIVLTADHGMMGHDPARTVYLNRVLPAVAEWFERGAAGGPKVPAGSPRDFFLHLREECFEEAVDAIRDALAGVAEVRAVGDLVAAGYFGDAPPSPRFLDRVGNAVILPYPGRAVWWYEEDRFESRHPGDHGGLSPDEMEIPFGVLSI
ncbi:MAG: alkaline phosphatase family protein [Immundisolibacterales bacterium]|nr:alkaline phosphatase family protein [Immundisolibacterales bacterium]